MAKRTNKAVYNTVEGQNAADTVREETAGYGGGIVIYGAPDGSVSLEVRLERDTLWLTQKQLSVLFATERSVITKHLRNIFESGELGQTSVCAEFAHTAADGKTYQVGQVLERYDVTFDQARMAAALLHRAFDGER